MTVRSRVRADLDNLRSDFLSTLGPTLENLGSDYRYRAKAPRTDVAKARAEMMQKLDYDNFKDEVGRTQGYSRARTYGMVWDVLHDLQADEAINMQAAALKKSLNVSAVSGEVAAKADAFGGLIVDRLGRVLLRRPQNDFDGYVWTFPKSRSDPGETAEETALREVKEETGYGAWIKARLPGQFKGGTSVTEFFVMTPKGEQGEFDPEETSAVRWATLDEAEKLIAMTTNEVGRERDLAVLASLREVLKP